MIILFPHLCVSFTYWLFHPFCFGIFNCLLAILSKTNKDSNHKINKDIFVTDRKPSPFYFFTLIFSG